LILCHSSSLLKLHYRASMMSLHMSGGANSNAVVGVRTVRMHKLADKEKFLRMNATTDLDMISEDALSLWELYEKTVDLDKLGPPQSPLRLNIPMEDFTFTEYGSVDADKKLKLSELEKMEDDFPIWRKEKTPEKTPEPETPEKTRKFMQVLSLAIGKYDVDETQTTPKKQMKLQCGV
jgi:hypothetical protein